MPVWIVTVIVPIILKFIDIIPTMITKKREVKTVRKLKHRMKNRVLILAGKPTIEEIARAGEEA